MADDTQNQETTQANGAEGTQPTQQKGLQIKRIYLKDLSFETPMGVEAFNRAWKPKIDQELNVQVNNLDDSHYEVVLLMTITATMEGKVVFLVEVKQAGLFAINGLEKAQLSQVINTTCPQILFPYTREVIDSTLSRGAFPPLMLPPINFDAVFAQAVQQVQKKNDAAQSADVESSSDA